MYIALLLAVETVLELLSKIPTWHISSISACVDAYHVNRVTNLHKNPHSDAD